MSDDITFCGSECNNKKCFRHPANIAEPRIPHSFADIKETEYCPMKNDYIDAVVKIRVPMWQIGQECSVYFPDSMRVKSKCEKEKIGEVLDYTLATGKETYKCSVCHKPMEKSLIMYPYCAMCGARLPNYTTVLPKKEKGG